MKKAIEQPYTTDGFIKTICLGSIALAIATMRLEETSKKDV